MKRSLPATVRRGVRRTIAWRPPHLGSEPVKIASLISPLRYDVRVRADFFSFLAARAEAPAIDMGQLVTAARSEPYFVWFERVAMTRFRPWVAADPDLLAKNFFERVERSLTLLHAVRDNGYDVRYPILLRTAAPEARTAAGLALDRRFFVADGCHRLALLLSLGRDVLPADHYRVDSVQLRTLPDNTATLLPMLRLREREYARHLASAYTDQQVDSLDALTRVVRERSPARLTELLAVIAAHGPALHRVIEPAPLAP